MKKMEHTVNGELIVHYDGAIGDYALCGHDLDGDEYGGDTWDSAKPSKKRVNCPNCIAIRNHVLGKKTL